MQKGNKNNSIINKITTGIVPNKNLEKKSEVYEVIRIEDRIALFIDEHLLRLKHSFKKLGLLDLFLHKELNDSIFRLIHDYKITNGNIKISCFIGDDMKCEYFIYSTPYSYPDPETYKNGIHTTLLRAERNNPNIKLANTRVRDTANFEIEKKHVFEALLVNHDQLITEGSRSNVFFIKNNIIYTAPDEMVLQGIVRLKTLQIINTEDMDIRLECIKANELLLYDAAFLTGTSPRILPIQSIENYTFDVNNKVLRKLMLDLQNEISAYLFKRKG